MTSTVLLLIQYIIIYSFRGLPSVSNKRSLESEDDGDFDYQKRTKLSTSLEFQASEPVPMSESKNAPNSTCPGSDFEG
jgi:hypothetical protein